MALLKEYSRQKRGLEDKEDFASFSYSYYRFFSQFTIDGDRIFLFSDKSNDNYDWFYLSSQLFLRCNHDMTICENCRWPPCCDNDFYCPCPRCYKTFSQKGIVPIGDRERVVLELLDFAYGQMAWIVNFKTQKEIRQNSGKMKDECRRRINFFIRKLEEEKDKFLPRNLSSERRREIFRKISNSKEYFGF